MNIPTENQASIQKWIIAKIAEAANVPAASISPDEPMTSYGIDSLAAALLSGDLSDWLGIDLDPTLLWECPTVSALAARLWESVSQTTSQTKDAPATAPLASTGTTSNV